MNFANPLALAWLGLLIPVVIFYILKIRLRRVPVSTVMFWQQVVDEQNPRSIWQRLRHLVSLLLQMAMLALLALALSDPFFPWEVRQARRIVLVLDNSASLQATDVPPSRWTHALDQAEAAIARLRTRDELAIVAAGTEPRVVCGFTSHGRSLRDALRTVSCTDGPTRVAEAIAMARQLLGERTDEKQREIRIISDACFPDAEALLTAVEPVSEGQPTTALHWEIVGQRSVNAGITQFQVRRSLLDPIGYEILAEVTNASDQPLECRFEVDLNEEPVDVIPLKLEAGGRWSQVMEKTSATGGHLKATLTAADALAVDNTAWAVLPHRQPQPVLLSAKDQLFLLKVLESIPLVTVTQSTELPTTIPASTVAVYHQATPTQLPPGNLLIVDPANSCDLWDVGAELPDPLVAKQDKDSPILAHVRLDNVLLPQARQLTFKQPDLARVLVTSVTGAPLLAAFERPAGKVLVLTVNLNQGDLPLRTAFPILMTNALGWFAGREGELRESVATGSTRVLRREELEAAKLSERQSLLLTSPRGEQRRLPAAWTSLTLGPFAEAGIWAVVAEPTVPASPDAPSATPLWELACNVASRAEADLRPPPTADQHLLDPASSSGWTVHPAWFWLIAGAWLLTTCEWILYQRRIVS